MIFEIKCKKCGSIAYFDTEKKSDNFVECKSCENKLSMYDEQKLKGATYTQNFDLIGIKRDFNDSRFDNDLKAILEIYEAETEENKKLLFNIIDKIYLIMNRKEQKEYQNILEVLRTYFFKSVDEKNNKTSTLLGLEETEND